MATRAGDAVVVITGASSGIGRATAHAFAARGARLVLAARRGALLDEAVRECEQRGGRAVAVPTDVRDPAAVDRLARTAVERFGRIDVWVNNAGVYALGRFDDIPSDVFRGVLDTNFFGYVHGARAALHEFRARGRGVLINNASILGRMGSALTSPYAASKFAIVGLTECLRQEVRDQPQIHVCTVRPASIDTPLFQHAANYTGRAVKALRPTYAPERVARAIVQLAEDPEREVKVGNAGRLMALLHAVAPGVYELAVPAQVERAHFRDEPAPATPGNVLAPMRAGGDVHGGWRARPATRGVALGGLAAAVPLVAWWIERTRRAAAASA